MGETFDESKGIPLLGSNGDLLRDVAQMLDHNGQSRGRRGHIRKTFLQEFANTSVIPVSVYSSLRLDKAGPNLPI
jgi:hypothetical protein